MRELLKSLFKRRPRQVGNAPARDGYWWRGLAESTRRAYVLGYLDGAFLQEAVGRAQGVAGTSARPKSRNAPEQVLHAVDDFFSAPENWQVPVPGALYYVRSWLEDPEGDWSALLQTLRRERS